MSDPRGVPGNEHNPDGEDGMEPPLRDCPLCEAEDIHLSSHLPDCPEAGT